MPEYKLPDVGEGLTEAEIVTWKVKVGDVIAINDIVVEIETAKSLVELPSPYAGEVTALLVAEGEMVEVGTPIILIGEPAPAGGAGSGGGPSNGSAPAPEMEIDLSNPAASGGGEGESLVGRNKADRGPVRRARKGAAAPAERGRCHHPAAGAGRLRPGRRRTSEPVPEADEPAEAGRCPRPTSRPCPPYRPSRSHATPATVRVLAKPPVRKLAKDLGVDLTTVPATGPNGTISRADVESAQR